MLVGGGGYIASKLTTARRIFLVDLSLSQLIHVPGNSNIVPICGNIESSVLRTKADIIISTHVLEHVLNPQKALNNFNESLKDGGKLYIAVPILNIPFFQKAIIYLFRKVKGSGYDDHLRVYSIETLTNDLNDAGFVVDKIKYHSFLPWSLAKWGVLDRLLAKGVSMICGKRK